VFDRRTEFAGQAGTHALICGVGNYTFLPGGKGPTTTYHFGLQQLDSPGRTAAAFYRWLLDHANDLTPPLVTSRLLLDLSEPAGDNAEARDLGADAPDLSQFLRAATGWREDAATHRGGTALCYVSGHGFQLGRTEHVLLMQDYGDRLGSILHNTINLGSLSAGMAPSDWYPEIARTQVYFIDAGQEVTTLPTELLGARSNDVFDIALVSAEDRVAVTFNATTPGGHAYAFPGGLTLFGDSLMRCLDGAAAELVGSDWMITVSGLLRAVPELVRQRGAEFELTQDVVVGGIIGSGTIARTQPPIVPVHVELPATGRKIQCSFLDSSLSPVASYQIAPGSRSLDVNLPAGLYVLQVSVAGGNPVQRTLAVSPPNQNVTIAPPDVESTV
jgi:hypothetical protein